MLNLAAKIELEKEGFLRLPYEFLGEGFEKLSFAALLGLTKIYSFSCKKEDPTASCRSKMSEFAADLHITERHSSRVIGKFIKAELVERVTDEEGKVVRSWYKYIGNQELGRGYIRIDLENLYKKFVFKADKEHGEKYERYLTLAELLVLSYMITHADNIKTKTGTFKGSYRSIARKLKMSPTTVSTAILNLMKAKLISRPEEDKAVNGSGWSTYHVAKELLRRTIKEEQKKLEARFKAQAKKAKTSSQEGQQKSPAYVPPQVAAANAKSARDRFYAGLRQKAQARADSFKNDAKENTRFAEIETELGKMEIEEAKAALGESWKLPEILRRRRKLKKERAKILEGMGICEEDLKPIFRCPKCSDTGFKKDGIACDCYPGSASVGIGELDKK